VPIVLSQAAFRDFRIMGESRTISISVSSGRLGAGSNIGSRSLFRPVSYSGTNRKPIDRQQLSAMPINRRELQSPPLHFIAKFVGVLLHAVARKAKLAAELVVGLT
jgi:hypothetical protein